ncbi:mediator of RNA polymerase II transcription subunit 13 isoform X3 [Planococcus citri]|uniref:mediator of RNA polymerase II transcription subunit 13 isoform X3 n=1 Tax=Planococcus citri TaxID=170843 RepID=UPI0031F7E5BD
MTHPSHETNGASLEDCHTNFYALTDLCGIKWRKWVWGEVVSYSPDPLQDPVLSSYSRCLSNDILCVWRRIGSPPNSQTPGVPPGGPLFDPLAGLTTMAAPVAPTLSLTVAKELWIFWYGDEPSFSNVISPELLTSNSGEQGSWESGLSYECRSLLFKALHNLIERCLLSHDFVRLGKWFVQPYDGSKKLIENSTHLSISFSFFVHGESTVCTSIDVRQHPPVRTLVKEHLEQMQSGAQSTQPIQVILAPFGLVGTLTGQTFKAEDAHTKRLLEEWKQFYPININSVHTVEPVVEVVLSGVKAKYPSCYVLVTDMDDSTANFYGNPGPSVKNSNQPVSGVPVTVVPLHQHHPESMAHPYSPATVLPERAWQDSIVSLPETPPISPCHTPSQQQQQQQQPTQQPQQQPQQQQQQPQPIAGPSNENLPNSECTSSSSGLWNFNDPTRKSTCYCFKHSFNSKQHPNSGPFSYQQSNSFASSQSQNSSGSAAGSGVGNLNDTCNSLPMNTPPSITPSPLPNPNSSQPSSVPTMSDPTMPTLSPQHPSSQPPPTPHSDDKIPRTPSEFQGPKSVSSTSNQIYSPYPSAPSIENQGSVKPDISRPSSVQLVNTLPSQSTPRPETPLISLKRPQLASKEYENALLDDETPSTLLYDYSLFDAWLNHPVKKFKVAEPKVEPADRNPIRKLMSQSSSFGYNNNSSNSSSSSSSAYPARTLNSPPEQLFIKQEPNEVNAADVASSSSSNNVANSAIRFKSDPFSFEDGAGLNIDTFNKRSASPLNKQEEDKKLFEQVTINGSKCTPNNLYTNEGLTASYKDLDQIFENSDDTSSDETALQVQTPPGSNKPAGSDECYSSTATLLVRPPRGSGGGNNGILRPEELSKMFPTPPSLEHNPIASPCGGHLSDTPGSDPADYVMPLSNTRYKQEICPSMGSPHDEGIDDWSFVFVPPVCAKMVGSSKYAPLTNLPSQSLPPVTLPSNAVYKPTYYYNQHQEKSKAPNNNSMNVIPSSSNASSIAANSAAAAATPGPSGVGSSGAGSSGLQSPLRPPSAMMLPHQPGTPHHHHIPPSPHHSHHSLVPSPHNAMHPHAGMHPRMGLSPISPSPGPYPPSPMMPWQQQYRAGGVRTPCQPPPPYSPASSAGSSYLNKNAVGSEPGNSTAATMLRPPEANSLVVNILLSDTLLNIFRDHNFDSCTLCVCNASAKVVGNIKGSDAGTYLPQSISSNMSPYPPYSPAPHHFVDEDSIRCSCGFSAVVNRRLSHAAGLFLEDEAEITGILEEPYEKDDLNGAASGVIDLVREQCVIVHSSCNALYRAARQYKQRVNTPVINMLEFRDTNEIALLALEQGRIAHLEAATVSMCKVDDMGNRQQMMQHCGGVNNRYHCIHRWPFYRAKGPRCNQDIIRVMKILQPLLQDAIQKKCSTRLWEAPYTVTGPLTWRQFHRLAGRGTDDRCEPQPIPPVVVGHDKDWLSVSPYTLHYWEKLLLEPYSYSRDVAYIVVAPDNDFVLQKTKIFFKELSSCYEICRLGRHSPISKGCIDGILRVSKNAAVKLPKEPVDEWFNMLADNSTTAMLRLYTHVCKHFLVSQLNGVTLDSSLFDGPDSGSKSTSSNNVNRPTPSPMPPPPSTTPDSSIGSVQSNSEKPPTTPKSEPNDECSRNESTPTSNSSSFLNDSTSHDDDDVDPPAIVIYLVEPVSVSSDDSDTHRLACLALLRCYNNVLSVLPEQIRSNITVQIISLESILELGRSGDRNRHCDEMRALALSVFSQCRRLLTHSSNVKALTGFGTAAMTDLFLKSKDEKNKAAYKAYCPPYILSKSREKLRSGHENSDCGGNGVGNSVLSSDQQCSILYVTYCLSEDQKWILVSAIDSQGIILETTTINIHIPNRSRRRKAPARRIGLQKVMDFILGVMSQSVTPWRLVVGRVGRLGHGELKGWSWLLSRKSLVRASKQLKEICGQCSLLYPTDVPCILSACLVSLEADSTLRVMPDQFTPDERFSQTSVNCQLSTPHDVTCTHILVFPTSATTQSSQTAFQEQQNNGPDLGDEDILMALNDDMPDGMGDFNDFLSSWPGTDTAAVRSPTGSPRGAGRSQPGSPCDLGDPNDQRSPFPCNGDPLRNGAGGADMQEEVGTLLQQPLALGYFVSTAPTGRMPKWFWSSCPHLENVCPAFLKSALHMHTTQQNSDELLQQSSVSGHPLDSQFTTDVLRYVLEGYNSLSWLAIDSNTHDRLSCLPVHMQVLMQLYHMMSALI